MTSLVIQKNKIDGYCDYAAKDILINLRSCERRIKNIKNELNHLAPKLDFLSKVITPKEIQLGGIQIKAICRIEAALLIEKSHFSKVAQTIVSTLGYGIEKPLKAKIALPKHIQKSIQRIAKKCRLYKNKHELYTQAKCCLSEIQQ